MTDDTRHILVVDDDADIRELLRDLLESEGDYRVTQARNGTEALSFATDGTSGIELIMMDVRMPDRDGISVLKELNDKKIDIPVIIMTANGTMSTAVKAMQLGADDYIPKPFETEEVLSKVQKFFEQQLLQEQVSHLKKLLDPNEKIIGSTPAMLDIYKQIGRLSGSDATVLITGETGTGKELIANVIHTTSRYSFGPFVAVNCAALPESLLESELFGHEKGAFTGAVNQHRGKFESANKGTIFLDEIGEMTLGTQSKFLRVLQERAFERVGGSLPVKIDARVVTATNRRLEDEVAAGRFRADLFFRLNVINIHLPPLRERKDDIPALVEHFMNKHRFTPSSPPARITEDALEALVSYDWPGNVRELENTVERGVVYARGTVITRENLRLPTEQPHEKTSFYVDRIVRDRLGYTAALDSFERALVSEALQQANNNETDAATMLNVEPEALRSLLAKHHIEPDAVDASGRGSGIVGGSTLAPGGARSNSPRPILPSSTKSTPPKAKLPGDSVAPPPPTPPANGNGNGTTPQPKRGIRSRPVDDDD